VIVPPFLLRTLYVKGSLGNAGDGFQLRLKNNLGSGYARELLPLTVDGVEVSPDQSYFVVDGAEVPFTDVGEERPFTLAKGRETVIGVRGQPLSEGKHTIGIGFVVVGLGKLGFDFTDYVSA